MGLSIGTTSSAVNSKLLVTKSGTTGESLANASVVVNSGGTSAWAQLVASTTQDTVITGIGYYTFGTVAGSPVALKFEIATGDSGSEVTLASKMLVTAIVPGNNYFNSWGNFAVLQRVAAGQRIAVRATQVTALGAVYTLITYISTAPYANLEGN